MGDEVERESRATASGTNQEMHLWSDYGLVIMVKVKIHWLKVGQSRPLFPESPLLCLLNQSVSLELARWGDSAESSANPLSALSIIV